MKTYKILIYNVLIKKTLICIIFVHPQIWLPLLFVDIYDNETRQQVEY